MTKPDPKRTAEMAHINLGYLLRSWDEATVQEKAFMAGEVAALMQRMVKQLVESET